MPFLEQLLFGGNPRRDASARCVLGTSAGLGGDVATEVERLCRGWGDAPPLGLDRPALLSFPLAATMPSIRGRLYAVIHVGTGPEPLLHAVVLGDQLYASFDRNPWLLARQVAFVDQWRRGATAPRLELEREAGEPPAGLIPGPGDRGFVDEAVVQHVLAGKLLLPLEATGPESDRALALMIAGLPVSLRREMRFASLAMSAANGYTLAALSTPGAAFAGWQRLLLSTPSSGLTAELAAYQAALAQALAAGDLNAVARIALRQDYKPAPRTEPIVTSVPDRRAQAEARPRASASPAPASPGPAPSGGTSANAPGAPAAAAAGAEPPGVLTSRASAAPGAGDTSRAPSDPRRGPSAAAAPRAPRPATMAATAVGVPTQPFGPSAASPSTPPAAPYRVTARGAGAERAGAGGRARLARRLAVGFGLVLLFGVAALRLRPGPSAEGADPARAAAPVANRAAGAPAEAPPPKVIDVGSVYDEQRVELAGSRGRLGPSPDQARRRTLASLTSRAAAPLTGQIALLADLAEVGIRADAGPAREAARLRALVRHGDELDGAVARLELAWFSLGSGTLWSDLASLPDAAVAARRDSLTRRDRTALDEARVGMALNGPIRDLAASRRGLAGLATLVESLEGGSWTPRWSADLKAAAEVVPASGGTVTRAYRNGALQLLRLKQAERAAGSRALPYADVLSPQTWPAPAVRALLPDLRRAVGAFAPGEAPALLAATLGLYDELADPGRAAAAAAADPRWLSRLQANAACRFDPAVYRPLLERVRYEAANARGGGDRVAPDETARFSRAAAVGRSTAGWRALADSLRDPFLSEWARRRAGGGREPSARQEAAPASLTR